MTADLTQEELAAKVGVNKSTVVRWERKENPAPPGFDTAIAVAEALGVSVEELAFGQKTFFERVVSEAVRRIREEPPGGSPR